MWCDQCREDVPAVARAKERTFHCPRCSGQLRTDSRPPAAEGESERDEPAAAETASPPPYDGWELDQQLEHIERVLRIGRRGGRESRQAYQEEAARLDPPHAGPSRWHVSAVDKPGRLAKPKPTPAQPVKAAMTWTALSLGTMTFVCGGILLGWSLVSGRTELWSVGVPVALCGQIALLLGLILQLDRLWHDSRHAAAKLNHVDEQLHELKTTTAMLSTGHHSPGSAFYSHLADGAGPQLLLSDLKSQLDLLAVKIGQNQGE